MSWKISDVNGLCISIFLNKMGWYLGVIGRIHNDEYLIYILTGKVENGTRYVGDTNNCNHSMIYNLNTVEQHPLNHNRLR